MPSLVLEAVTYVSGETVLLMYAQTFCAYLSLVAFHTCSQSQDDVSSMSLVEEHHPNSVNSAHEPSSCGMQVSNFLRLVNGVQPITGLSAFRGLHRITINNLA